MKISITLILTFFTLSIFAQTHGELIGQANKFYANKNYSESTKAYASAFKIEEGTYSDYYNAACSAALAGQEKEAFAFLKISADKGWKGYKHMHKDTDLKSLWEKDAWEPIVAVVKATLDEYEKDFDKPLMAQLDKIRLKDQTLRMLLDDVEERFGGESEEMTYFWEIIQEQDSINELAVLKIIDERGWPGSSLVGGNANTTVWLVIQHAPLATQEKYLPLLKESVKKGESRGSNLALLEDRIEMRNERPQIYGSQISMNKETKKYEVFNLLDPENVDKRRAEVGLGPLADYVSRWDIEFTVEQKK